MQLGLCSMRRGNPMPSHYCTSCIGCQSSSWSHTSWQFWHTKFGARPSRFTCTTKSRNVSAAEQLYAHLPSRCWSNRSPGETFPGVLSDIQHRLPGTRCHKQLWSATRGLFLNLDLKLFLTQAFTEHWPGLPPAPLKLGLQLYGAI